MSDKPPFPFARVVVLGSTGFLGARISDLLRSTQATIVGIGSKDLDLRKETCVAGLQELAGEETAFVFSSALTPDRGQSLGTLADNLAMAMNVGKVLESSKLGLCVNISSDAVYPLTANPITEESPIDPAGYYGLAKYAAEKLLERAAAAAKTRFLNLRVTALYGPGDTHGSYGPNSFMKSLVKDKTICLFGEGEEKRDHLHVDDAAHLTCELMAACVIGTFNLATGRSVTFREVADLLRNMASGPVEVMAQPRKAAITHRHFDVSRLIRAVPNFRCRPLEDGLKAYYRAAATGGS